MKKKHSFRKQFQYVISRSIPNDYKVLKRLPTIINESTLIIRNGDSIVFVLTKMKDRLLFSYYDEISQEIATFLAQAIIFENLLFNVSKQTQYQPKKIADSYPRLSNSEEIQKSIDSSYKLYKSLLAPFPTKNK